MVLEVRRNELYCLSIIIEELHFQPCLPVTPQECDQHNGIDFELIAPSSLCIFLATAFLSSITQSAAYLEIFLALYQETMKLGRGGVQIGPAVCSTELTLVTVYVLRTGSS